jgi:hypothetical protein
VRQAPQAELDLTGRYLDYYTQQSLQQDMQNTLMDPEKVEDNFNEAFYRHIFVRQ